MTTGFDSRRSRSAIRVSSAVRPLLVIDDEHDGVGFLDCDRDLLGDERRDRVAIGRCRPPVSMTMKLRSAARPMP